MAKAKQQKRPVERDQQTETVVARATELTELANDLESAEREKTNAIEYHNQCITARRKLEALARDYPGYFESWEPGDLRLPRLKKVERQGTGD